MPHACQLHFNTLQAECSQYQEEILYNVSILFDNTNDNKIVNSRVYALQLALYPLKF